MYTTSSWSIVHALDARTGKHLWTYDPRVAKDKARHACCDVVNRGVAVWEGQVFVGALDGRLVALDAATGNVNWEVATVDPLMPYTITGAPRVIDGKVLIGNGGAEYGVRGFLGAYAAENRQADLAFLHGARGSVEGALRTTPWQWRRRPGTASGGKSAVAAARFGTPWPTIRNWTCSISASVTVPPGTGRYAPPAVVTTCFSPLSSRCGPTTGEYVWHYQTTPGETWDYTATQHIILADIELDGKTRKVLMQAPKNGFFYVLDRTDGTLLSAKNYMDITWATHVDMETGRPVEVKGARYEDKPFLIFPSYLGGHNWHPMSYNPMTGLVYIPVLDFPANYGQQEVFEYRSGVMNTGTDGIIGSLPDSQAERDALGALIKGRLVAWDPVRAAGSLAGRAQRHLERRHPGYGRQPGLSGHSGGQSGGLQGRQWRPSLGLPGPDRHCGAGHDL